MNNEPLHMSNSELQIFRSLDGKTEIQVKLEGDTVWLNQYQLESLFDTDRTSINRHVNKMYRTGELDEKTTCAKITQVQLEGGREVERQIAFYNLDVIMAIGYRVNSRRGVEFRTWSNRILKEYLVRGFTINEKSLSEQEHQLSNLRDVVKTL